MGRGDRQMVHAITKYFLEAPSIPFPVSKDSFPDWFYVTNHLERPVIQHGEWIKTADFKVWPLPLNMYVNIGVCVSRLNATKYTQCGPHLHTTEEDLRHVRWNNHPWLSLVISGICRWPYLVVGRKPIFGHCGGRPMIQTCLHSTAVMLQGHTGHAAEYWCKKKEQIQSRNKL